MSREISPRTRRLFKDGAADVRAQLEGRQPKILEAEIRAAELFAARECGERRRNSSAVRSGMTYMESAGFRARSGELFPDGLLLSFQEYFEPRTVELLTGWLLHAMERHDEEQSE